MTTDLTVDTLCEALRYFLRDVVDYPENPLPCEGHHLLLMGVPADDAMKAALEATGGELRITIRALPAELKQALTVPEVTGQQANLWQPSKEA